jgi:thiol-disulfide isomerase/thioredoxin
MTKIRLAAIFLASALSVSRLEPAAAADGQERAHSAGANLIGTAAPALKLQTIDGSAIDLAPLLGHKPVYLKFWATWCVPCREQMPHFESTYERVGSDMAVIAVDAGFNETADAVRAYRAKMGLRMPIVMDDGQVADAFHLRVTPQHVVIGRDGRILYIGHLVDPQLENALSAALTQRETAMVRVAAPSSRHARFKVGSAVGELTVTSTEGMTVPLADPAHAQRTILAFISPWCESYLAKSRPLRATECKNARLGIEALAKDHPGERIIGLASGLWADQDDVRDYMQKNNVSIPIAVDESGELFRGFSVRDVPTFIVLDPAGRVTARLARLRQEALARSPRPAT